MARVVVNTEVLLGADGSLRYLFGIRGPALIEKAIGPGSRVITASAIESYIEQLLNQLQ